MVKPRVLKIVKVTDPINWWSRYGLLGKVYLVLDVSKYGYAKIEYESDKYGWVPLEMCEINPHLKVVK